MDIDINQLAGQVDEEKTFRTLLPVQHAQIGLSQGSTEDSVFYRAAIDEKELALAVRSSGKRSRAQAAQPIATFFIVNRHQAIEELPPIKLVNPFLQSGHSRTV